MTLKHSSGRVHDTISLAPSPESSIPARQSLFTDSRVLLISALCIPLGIAAALIAKGLLALIGLITNYTFYGRLSTEFSSPAMNHLGLWVILVPVVGGLIVGAMAKWGSKAIRGHGIPEAMEKVLRNQSRIPPRMIWLKPVSSAIVIGTGGPFGAEGPIIATGGALGSLFGQIINVTADERKALLAAGAAAGMAAIFDAPVSAILLAVELLLFERRARTLVPVIVAVVSSTSLRYVLEGDHAVFAMSHIQQPGVAALISYTLLGAVLGVVAVVVTKFIYAVEDAFEKLPLHWMYWPAIGGLVIGVVGFFEPQTLGVGYDNISAILNGHMAVNAMLVLCLLKFLSWSIALGSGTSGGTLAPLFMVGGALGGIAGTAISVAFPQLGIDPRIAAMVGMAALFAGASRAFMASVVFAFETTQQYHGILPLLAGCTASFLVSGLMMQQTIMTGKIHRRGVRVPSDYSSDYLATISVGMICSRDVVFIEANRTVQNMRQWLDQNSRETQHQGYPVKTNGHIIGVITRKDISNTSLPPGMTVGDCLTRPLLTISETHSAREAADYMVESDVGRLLVISDGPGPKITGIITRGDLLAAHSRRLKDQKQRQAGTNELI
ncbi:chloride channel protein [Tatumella morbirosei]|uniref:chloride channel protein n=1 Tax=Tatumella morbirosei TaxID=642227 RepID=UPI00062A313A|nr:chloride channel protein [Tatumella morbirosei]